MCERCHQAAIECKELLDRHTYIYKNGSTIPSKQVSSGYVYFFSDKGFHKIKIGYTKNTPFTRMEEFEIRHNEKFIMLAIWPVYQKYTERRIHKYFKHLRIDKKYEWFYFNHHICGFLKTLWLKFFCAMDDGGDINWMWGIEHE